MINKEEELINKIGIANSDGFIIIL